MKKTLFALTAFFFANNVFALALSPNSDKGLCAIPIGTKIKILKDDRPNGKADGQIGTIVGNKEMWALFDTDNLDPDNALQKSTLRPKDFPAWDPDKEKEIPGTKFAMLLGSPVLELENGTRIEIMVELSSAANWKFVNPKEYKNYADKQAEKMGRLIFAILAKAAEESADPAKPDTEESEQSDLSKSKFPPLPEPEFAVMKNLGKTDYQWPLKTLYGRDFDFTSVREKVVFINIWATWCGPCLLEMPSMQKLYEQIKSEVVFLFVTDEDKETVRKWLEKNKEFTMPIYMTKPRALPDRFKTDGIPATFIIAKDGRIVFRHIGAAKWDGEKTIDFLRMFEATPIRLRATPAKPVKK